MIRNASQFASDAKAAEITRISTADRAIFATALERCRSMTDFAAYMGQVEAERANEWLRDVIERYAKITGRTTKWAGQVLDLQKRGLCQWFDDGVTADDAAHRAAALNLELTPKQRRRRKNKCGG